jgi:hypothetical protein
MFMDLDDPRPRSMERSPENRNSGSAQPSGPHFAVNTVVLEKGEQVVFAVVAHVEESLVAQGEMPRLHSMLAM